MEPGEPSDRDTLRWACRQAMPCVVVRAGRAGWGRSALVDLREDGPRPQLSVAQPLDLSTGAPAPLGAGESVRIWSVRDAEPWGLSGVVGSVGVVEGHVSGPVEAARVVLPYRLLKTDRRLGHGAEVGLRVALAGDGEPAGSTLLERWLAPSGEPVTRGPAHVVELSRRAFTFSVPLGHGPLHLPGSWLRLRVELPAAGLAAVTHARVQAVFECDEHLLYGLSLAGPDAGTCDDEHRDVVRRAGF